MMDEGSLASEPLRCESGIFRIEAAHQHRMENSCPVLVSIAIQCLFEIKTLCKGSIFKPILCFGQTPKQN